MISQIGGGIGQPREEAQRIAARQPVGAICVVVLLARDTGYRQIPDDSNTYYIERA
jgi:hypothetical protein